MADDEDLKPHHATARPPPGEEDVYSANTVASEASDEILAIIRGESQRAFPAAPGLPTNLKLDPTSEPKIAVRPDAKPTANAVARSELPDMRATAPPPPRPVVAKPPPPPAAKAIKTPTPAAGAPPPPSSSGGSKPAYTATPLEVPVTKLTATSEPPRSVEIAPDPDPDPAPPAEAPPASKPETAPAPAAMSTATRATEADPNIKRGTMHPAVGIVLFFVAMVVVLAAPIR